MKKIVVYLICVVLLTALLAAVGVVVFIALSERAAMKTVYYKYEHHVLTVWSIDIEPAHQRKDVPEWAIAPTTHVGRYKYTEHIGSISAWPYAYDKEKIKEVLPARDTGKKIACYQLVLRRKLRCTLDGRHMHSVAYDIQDARTLFQGADGQEPGVWYSDAIHAPHDVRDRWWVGGVGITVPTKPR